MRTMGRATRNGFRKSHGQLELLIFTLVVAATWIFWPSSAAAIEAPACIDAKQQSAVINFFIHDDLDVKPTASAFSVVQGYSSPNGVTNNNLFGSIVVFDDSITDGPEVTSTELARGRGFYVFDYLSVGSTTASLEFVFTAIFSNQSDYEGSTLTFKGYDKIDDTYREIAITGGTGTFRLARGWAGIYTYASNGGAAILNTTCYVYYGCNYGVNSASGKLQTWPSFLTISYVLATFSALLGYHSALF